MRLSIIVCLYNTDKKYFEECLSSITKSTLEENGYELIVIDDGSDDDYSDITEKYGARLIKTENRGIFQARLLGTQEANGDYIAFVDSDDTVTFNYHLPMLLEAEEQMLDICFNDWAFHTERTKYVCLADSTVSRDFTYTDNDVLAAYLKSEGREHSYFVLWNKLFKSSVLKASLRELKQIADEEERYNYSEDALISFFAFKNSSKISNVHTGYYFYRIHTGQAISVTDEKKLYCQIKYMGKTLDIIFSEVAKLEGNEEMRSYVRKWAELMSRSHYSHAKANKYYHLYDFIKESYHINKLERATFKDQSAYSKNKVLPVNLNEIEKRLLELWRAQDEEITCLCHSDDYMKKSVRFMRAHGKNITLRKNVNPLPKPKVKLKDRIIMNKLVYTLGLIFFKKGSRIRAFLKKHI